MLATTPDLRLSKGGCDRVTFEMATCHIWLDTADALRLAIFHISQSKVSSADQFVCCSSKVRQEALVNGSCPPMRNVIPVVI